MLPCGFPPAGALLDCLDRYQAIFVVLLGRLEARDQLFEVAVAFFQDATPRSSAR